MRTTTDTMHRTPEACELSGATYRQADYWCRIGLLVPQREARGSGSWRGYTLRQVQTMWALAQLADAIGAERLTSEVTATLCEAETFTGWLLVEHIAGRARAEVITDPLSFCDAVSAATGAAVVLALGDCPIASSS